MTNRIVYKGNLSGDKIGKRGPARIGIFYRWGAGIFLRDRYFLSAGTRDTYKKSAGSGYSSPDQPSSSRVMNKMSAGSGEQFSSGEDERGEVFTHRGRHRGRLSGSLTQGVLLTDVSEIICPAETHVPTPGEDFCSKYLPLCKGVFKR